MFYHLTLIWKNCFYHFQKYSLNTFHRHCNEFVFLKVLLQSKSWLDFVFSQTDLKPWKICLTTIQGFLLHFPGMEWGHLIPKSGPKVGKSGAVIEKHSSTETQWATCGYHGHGFILFCLFSFCTDSIPNSCILYKYIYIYTYCRYQVRSLSVSE